MGSVLPVEYCVINLIDGETLFSTIIKDVITVVLTVISTKLINWRIYAWERINIVFTTENWVVTFSILVIIIFTTIVITKNLNKMSIR